MASPSHSILSRIGKTLADRSELVITEPLPKTWLALIHVLNERERLEREAADQDRKFH